MGDWTAVRNVGEPSKGETGDALLVCNGESTGETTFAGSVRIDDCGTTISTWRGVRRGGRGKVLAGSKRSDEESFNGCDVAMED